MNEALRVAVLFGGTSAERDVSLESGQVVGNALRERGHAVTLVDPRDIPIATVDWLKFDCAFNALHGSYGEDGTVQRELESFGVPYTGSSPEASRVAFDKSLAKQRFQTHKIATPPSAVVSSTVAKSVRTRLVTALGLPVVIKPVCQGSSFGVSIVRDENQIEPAFTECFRFGNEALVEELIVGEEWTVGVLDRRPLTPIRIATVRSFYDYQAKYDDDRTSFHVAGPNDDTQLVEALRELSVRACAAIGTAGIARVDLMVDENRSPWLLEVNTVPGFTSHSLIPKAATSEGIQLGSLFESALPSRQTQSRKHAG